MKCAHTRTENRIQCCLLWASWPQGTNSMSRYWIFNQKLYTLWGWYYTGTSPVHYCILFWALWRLRITVMNWYLELECELMLSFSIPVNVKTCSFACGVGREFSIELGLQFDQSLPLAYCQSHPIPTNTSITVPMFT